MAVGRGAGARGGMSVSAGKRQRNFLLDYNLLLDAVEHDYVDCERYRSSGYAEFIGRLYTMNPAMFQDPALCDRTLTQIALHYLTWFQDPALRLLVGPGAAWHIRQTMRVRPVGERLVVTRAVPDSPVSAGEEIAAVNGTPVPRLRRELFRTLRTTAEPPDVEREDWSVVLAFARSVAVVGPDGTARTDHLAPGRSIGADREREMLRAEREARERGERPSRAEVVRAAAERLAARGDAAPDGDGGPAGAHGAGGETTDALAAANDLGWAPAGGTGGSDGVGCARPPVEVSRAGGACVVTVRPTGREGYGECASLAAAEAASALREGASGLVVDVRDADGGAMEDLYPLVGLLMGAGGARRDGRGSGGAGGADPAGRAVSPAELFGTPGVVWNRSRRNLAARLAELGSMRAAVADGDAAAGELDALMAELSGQEPGGLVRDDADYFAPAAFSPADAPAHRTAVLCDRRTADAAEWLVRAARSVAERGLGDVLVMGRATRGSLDNTSPRLVALDGDFTLVVPTAKYLFAAGPGATLGRGIRPDVHLGWTREQLREDAELDAARRAACSG